MNNPFRGIEGQAMTDDVKPPAADLVCHLYNWDRKTGQVRRVSMAEWTRQREDMTHVLAATSVGGTWVSTLFVGMWVGRADRRPPMWETLVTGVPLDGRAERYHTQEEAEAGHRRVVREVRRAMRARP